MSLQGGEPCITDSAGARAPTADRRHTDALQSPCTKSSCPPRPQAAHQVRQRRSLQRRHDVLPAPALAQDARAQRVRGRTDDLVDRAAEGHGAAHLAWDISVDDVIRGGVVFKTTAALKKTLSESGYSGYPPGTAPGMPKCGITRHWFLCFDRWLWFVENKQPAS